MKTKPKRIRALRMNITPHDAILTNEYDDTEPCYILRQSDIRALAGQMVRDIDEVFNRFEGREAAVLESLKRAGMTPGKEAQ